MKTMIRSAILLLLVSLPTALAQGFGTQGSYDAYTLREALHATDHSGYTAEDAFNEAFAFGYVIGVSQGLDTIAFCRPEHTRQGQIRDVVVKYLTDHPEQLHKDSFDVVGDALEAAFPCPPPGPPNMVISRPRVEKEGPIPKKP